MARGRKPDTAEQQAQKGAPGKRMTQSEATAVRTNAKPQPVAVGNVRPPKFLKRSRKATEIWNLLAPLLTRMNLLTELDALAQGRYCRYLVEWIAADQAVQKEGTWYEVVGTNGEMYKKQHPAWQAMQRLEPLLRDHEADFGMRPGSRYKTMRDQAAVHGMLPLFGDDAAGRESREEQVSNATPAPEEEALGLLGSFDTVPLARPN